jgi:chorismate mutase
VLLNEPMNNSIQQLRNQIDQIDRGILDLLSERFQLIESIKKEKKQNGFCIQDIEREQFLLEDRNKYGESIGVHPRLIEKMFQLIIEESILLQQE